ncbi:MAG: hypothetical protein JWP92_3781 [Caulobacter sp.]|nr:hypothetical protein [Caulobacter sp.]
MSKPITIVIPHALGVPEARRRIEEGLAQLVGQAGGGLAKVHQTWDGDQMTFSAQTMGQTITGVLHVLGDAVRMEVVLPGLLGMIAGKIKGQVQKQGTLLLEKK